MARLIDADALMKDICDSLNQMTDIGITVDGDWLWAKLNDAIDNAPTIDAEPVKHGRWVLNSQGNWSCSRCGFDPYHNNMKGMNYCPNCGSKNGGEHGSD